MPRSPQLGVRLDTETWNRLVEHAQARGETVSEVIRRAVLAVLDEPASPPTDTLLNAAEAAAECGVAVATINNWVRDGYLPVAAETLSGRRFSPEAVDLAARSVRKPGRPPARFDYYDGPAGQSRKSR